MFKNSFFYTIERLFPKVLAILLLPIILRLVKPSLWAEITILLAIQLLISYFLTQGDESSILKFTADDNILVKSVASVTKYSFVALIFIELIGRYIENLPFSIIYGLPFRFMILSTILISINKLFLSKLRSLERAELIFKTSTFESIFNNIFQLLLIAVVVQIDGYDSRVIVTVYFAVQFFGNLIKMIYLIKKLNFRVKLLFQNLFSKKPDDFLTFSNTNFFILITGYFLNWQDKFFVERLFDLDRLGIYSVSSRIANLGMVFIVSILVAAYARYWPNDQNEETDTKVTRITADIIIISSLVFTSLSLIGQSVGEYIVPNSYKESINILYLATILVFLHTLVLIFTIDFGRQNKIKILIFFNLFVFLSQIFLYFFFNFDLLEDVYVMQIITMVIFIPIFFIRELLIYKKNIILSFLLVSLSTSISYFYLNYGTQLIQITGFLTGCVCIYFCLNKWINRSSNCFNCVTAIFNSRELIKVFY